MIATETVPKHHPLFGSLRINKPKMYLRVNSGEFRDCYMHRAVFTKIAGRPPKPGHHIHHMNGKYCACPHQLVELPPELHVAVVPRCPITGRFLNETERQWERLRRWNEEHPGEVPPWCAP